MFRPFCNTSDIFGDFSVFSGEFSSYESFILREIRPFRIRFEPTERLMYLYKMLFLYQNHNSGIYLFSLS